MTDPIITPRSSRIHFGVSPDVGIAVGPLREPSMGLQLNSDCYMRAPVSPHWSMRAGVTAGYFWGAGPMRATLITLGGPPPPDAIFSSEPRSEAYHGGLEFLLSRDLRTRDSMGSLEIGARVVYGNYHSKTVVTRFSGVQEIHDPREGSYARVDFPVGMRTLYDNHFGFGIHLTPGLQCTNEGDCRLALGINLIGVFEL